MRERHNIVGSEVGRARPPIYFQALLKRRPRRRDARKLLVGALLVVALVVAGLAWFEHSTVMNDAPGYQSWATQLDAGS